MFGLHLSWVFFFIYDVSDTFVRFMSTRITFSAVGVYLLRALLKAMHGGMNIL